MRVKEFNIGCLRNSILLSLHLKPDLPSSTSTPPTILKIKRANFRENFYWERENTSFREIEQFHLLSGGGMTPKPSRNFPSVTTCNVSGGEKKSVAADLDGTLLISRSSFPYFMLIAVEAGSLLRGLILLLSFPLIVLSYLFVSESLGIQILIYISFAGLRIRDIELASRAVLPRFYAADVRRESWEVFEKCGRRVVVTANPIVMVDYFVKEFLGADKVLGTEIEVDPKTKKATGFVKKSGVLVGDQKRLAILKEFGEESPDIGLGDRKTDHDFMSICKVPFVPFSSNFR